MDAKLKIIADQISKVLDRKEQMKKETLDFMEQINSPESSLTMKSDYLRQLINTHANLLLQELGKIKAKKPKKVKIVKQTFKEAIIVLDSYMEYCEALKEK